MQKRKIIALAAALVMLACAIVIACILLGNGDSVAENSTPDAVSSQSEESSRGEEHTQDTSENSADSRTEIPEVLQEMTKEPETAELPIAAATQEAPQNTPTDAPDSTETVVEPPPIETGVPEEPIQGTEQPTEAATLPDDGAIELPFVPFA